MKGSSTITIVKLLLVGILSFTLVLSASCYYTGLRYGKRSKYDASTQLVSPSASPIRIQIRAREGFYSSTRFGRKRSYLETPMTDSEIPLLSDVTLKVQQLQAGNQSPYECFQVSDTGVVRCLPRLVGNTMNSIKEDDEDSDVPLTGIKSSSTGASDYP